jgi:hypothetical protein
MTSGAPIAHGVELPGNQANQNNYREFSLETKPINSFGIQ